MAIHTTGRLWSGALLALVLAGATIDRADAGTLTMTGTMDGSVNGSPFTDAAFTAIASFYWSDDVIPPSVPVQSYPSALSITITGEGTYAADPSDEIYAVFYQPPVFGNYGIEIQYSPTPFTINNIAEFFSAETFVSGAQTLLLSNLLDASSSGPFSLPLVDSGTLQIDAFDSLGPTSTASIYVPEPASLSLFGLGLAATGLVRRRRRAV